MDYNETLSNKWNGFFEGLVFWVKQVRQTNAFNTVKNTDIELILGIVVVAVSTATCQAQKLYKTWSVLEMLN